LCLAASTQRLSTFMRVPTPPVAIALTPVALTACVPTTTRPPPLTTAFAHRCILVALARWPPTMSPYSTWTMARAASQGARTQTALPPSTCRAYAMARALQTAAGSSAARTIAGTRRRPTTGLTRRAARGVSTTRRVAPTPGPPTIWGLRTLTTVAAPSLSMGAPTQPRSTSTRPPPCLRAASLLIRAAPTAPRRATLRRPIQTTAAACIPFTAALMLVRSTLTRSRP